MEKRTSGSRRGQQHRKQWELEQDLMVPPRVTHQSARITHPSSQPQLYGSREEPADSYIKKDILQKQSKGKELQMEAQRGSMYLWGLSSRLQ